MNKANLNKPNPTLNDVVGLRVRALRKIMGLSQAELADKIDVTYQQLQKYECGKNNMSINMLHRIGEALEQTPAELLSLNDSKPSSLDALAAAELDKIGKAKEINLEIMSKLEDIKDLSIRKGILRLIDSLVDSQEPRSE